MPALYQNVWAQGNYIYHTTDSGVDVYNDDASLLDYHIGLPSAATAVWANDSYIYMGTVASGVYRSTISGTASQYLVVPDILSNDTVYLHGSGIYLCLTTASGVDRYNLTAASGISTLISGTGKCYQTSTGPFYYAVAEDLYANYSTVSGWSTPDYTYSDQLLFVTQINDIYITEGTSSYSNNNTIFLATNVGAHVIEERQGDEENSNIKRYYIS